MNEIFKNKDDILSKIEALESELKQLKNSLKRETVSVPDQFISFFENAQNTVNEYFSKLNFNPEKGSIEINDERYILVRASSLSIDFHKNIQELYSEKSPKEAFEFASDFLFDLGHLIGKEDAKKFHNIIDFKNPIEKLSTGPVHFAYSGWAFVEILEESNPTPGENFFLKYNHPYSFEADAWIKKGEKSEAPVCMMNAAYSSGWCSESYGIPLTAVEITCRAKGDQNCTFVMAHKDKIEHYLEEEIINEKLKSKPQIPYFFERKEIEAKLKQQEFLLKSSQSLSKIGSWEFDVKTKNLIWSEELYNIFEIDKQTSSEKLYEMYISRILGQDLPELEKCTQKALNGEKYTIQHGIETIDGNKKWIFGTGIPVKNNSGKVIKIMGYAQDITNSITTEIELNKFFKLSMDMLCVANFDGEFVKVSKGWENSLGFPANELIGKKFIDFVHKDDIDITLKTFEYSLTGENIIDFENRYKTLDGNYRILNWNSAPDKDTGLIYCIVKDVTLERLAEIELKNTLHEKEVLLKEVHHRVKNNMQIISSLLNLQTSFIESPDILNLYKESQNRIKSIGGIHELLYQSSNLGEIKFEDYLKKLIPDLIYSYFGNENNVKVEIDADVHFNIDTSIPLGLIINEIISNSLKHGLTNTENGTIYLKIRKIFSGKYEMIIGDNGKGFESPEDKDNSKSLGLMLIDELSNQLNGIATKTIVKKGTEYKIIFNEI